MHQVYQTALHFDYANSKKAHLDAAGMTSSRDDREEKAVGALAECDLFVRWVFGEVNMQSVVQSCHSKTLQRNQTSPHAVCSVLLVLRVL